MRSRNRRIIEPVRRTGRKTLIVAAGGIDDSRIQAIDNVNLDARMGTEDRLRWFYGELVGLDEVASDGGDPHRLCFKSGRIELRVRCVPSGPRMDAVSVRLTLFVDSLEVVAEQLEERSIPYTRLTGLAYSDRRIELHDPGGNRVALKQSSYVGLL